MKLDVGRVSLPVWRLLVVDEAIQQLDVLPDHAQTLVRRELNKLLENPRHAAARAMWGEWGGHWRVRAGVYRVVYQIHHPDRIVVVRIGGPGSVYALRRTRRGKSDPISLDTVSIADAYG